MVLLLATVVTPKAEVGFGGEQRKRLAALVSRPAA